MYLGLVDRDMNEKDLVMTQENSNNISLIVSCTIIAVTIISGGAAVAIYGSEPGLDMVFKALTALGVMFGPVLVVYFQKQLAEKAKIEAEGVAKSQAKEVAEVKEVLAENTKKSEEKFEGKLDDIQATGKVTHALVNSAMGDQKKLTAIVSRALAEETKNPKHIAAAELAEKIFKEHEAQQIELNVIAAKPEGEETT